MHLSEKTKRIIKKGFVGIEYCVIGALIILGAITMYRISTENTKDHMEAGAKGMDDNPGVIFSESTGKGYLITNLDVVPGDISLKLGETKKVTTIISPSNVWNYNLTWNTTAADAAVVQVTPGSGTVEANFTGLSEGKALVQVKTTDGSELSKDVIVRVGYPITEFSVVGERVFNSTEVGILDIVFDDENVTWKNKSVELILRSETEFGGEGVATSGTPKLQTNVANFVVTESGRVIVYPKQGGTIRFDVTVTDHTFETSFTETVDLSIQSYYYRYRDLSDWTEWSTTKVEGEYNEEKTQYGYQTVKSWKDEWLTTKPSDGYYNSRTQFGYQDVNTWKDEWLTTKPADGFYNKRTQYGYKDVATWGTTVLTSKPADGYYKTIPASTENSTYSYNSGGSWQGPTTGARSATIDVGKAVIPTKISHGTYCHTQVGTRTWYGSTNGSSWVQLGTTKTTKGGSSMESTSLSLSGSTAYRYYSYIVSGVSSGYKSYDTSVWKCTGSGSTGAGYEQFEGLKIEYKVNIPESYRAPASWGNEVYDSATAYSKTTSRMPLSRDTYQSPSTWKDAVWSTTATTAFVKTTSRNPLSQTTYQSPSEWNAATGWRDSTAYTKTTTTKPVTRTMYRYKAYGAWSDWFVCDVSGCPESTTTRQVEIRIGAG